MADAFGSATSVNDEGRKKLLEAVATAGTAGRKAYDDARAGIDTQQQEALARAQQQASLGGVTEAGLAEIQGKTSNAYGQRVSALDTMRTGFEGALNQTGASGAAYFDKLGATVPVLQEQNRMKIADRENEIKAMIAEAQAKAEADAAAQAEKNAFQLERDAYREENANNRAAATLAAKNAPKPPTVDQLLGAAVQAKGKAQGLTKQAPYVVSPKTLAEAQLDATGIQNLAQSYGQQLGVDGATLAGIFAPSKNSSIQTTIKNMTPKQFTAQAEALAKKYAKINVTPKVASDIIKDVDFQDNMDWIMKGAPDKDGKPTPQDQVVNLLRNQFLVLSNKPRSLQILMDALNENVMTAGQMSATKNAKTALAK